jgi:hypothetical protein
MLSKCLATFVLFQAFLGLKVSNIPCLSAGLRCHSLFAVQQLRRDAPVHGNQTDTEAVQDFLSRLGMLTRASSRLLS